MIPYEDFLRSKVKLAPSTGLLIDPAMINPALKEHQAIMVRWNVEGGQRACFAAFGLGKTLIQLETVRLVLALAGGRGLIVCPLGVRAEFVKDAQEILGWSAPPKFVRSLDEIYTAEDRNLRNANGAIYLTNYETVRDGKLDLKYFTCISLDEASIMRGGGGSMTFRELMRRCTGDEGPRCDGMARKGAGTVPYRFVATATPSPNDYIELLNYAAFLGVMDISQAKTRFFKRDSTKADVLTLHPHMEESFWLWVNSWALFVQRPSDLGCSDEGYVLPPLDVRWHEVATDHSGAGYDRGGQGKLIRDAAIGVQDSAAEKRNSLPARIAKMMELRAEDPAAHRILWHDLESEREAIEHIILSGGVESRHAKHRNKVAVVTVPESRSSARPAQNSFASVYGTQDLDEREELIAAFSRGEFQELATKPVLCGSGCNFQRHCAWAVFLGIGFKFNDFIQAIHRLQRFLQTRPVRVDLIYSEAERGIRKSLERKWQQHNQMVAKMTDIIRKYGLNHQAMAQTLTRKMGVERIETAGKNWRLVNNDCVLETRLMPADSVGLVLSSWPFSTQYEYSPSFNDFGHNDGNADFFEQLDYLTPEIYRTLMPGRIYAVHVKDRIVPGGMTGLGFQTVYPFHARCIDHCVKHGFGYLGMKTIVTDVVRENNQTYRLGWSEQLKDGSKMGVGMPEYLLLFRKPPTDSSNGYADVPVLKPRPLVREASGATRRHRGTSERSPIVPGSGYTLARWQIDAHGFTRSAGDRLLDPRELLTLQHQQIFKLFRAQTLNEVYNFEHHVTIGETLEVAGKLPSDFMLLQPQSWSDEVWTDITRMLTLNGSQHAKGKEKHICPMQLDIADRVIAQMSNPGDVVYDPFAGLGTVPLRAMKQGRIGWGCELAPGYWSDAVAYCRAEEDTLTMPTLFDLAAMERMEFAEPQPKASTAAKAKRKVRVDPMPEAV